ncbi:MAG TPA: hypothetical protein VIM07_00775 [Chitinophagaceae bacterium]
MSEIGYKICEACKQEKAVTDFYFRKDSGKYRTACKKCKSVVTKEQIAQRVNAITKICTHCNIEKSVSEYQKAGRGKWTQPYCKLCDAERKRKYCEENKTRLKEKSRNYYLDKRENLSVIGKAERAAKRPETLKRMRSLIDAKKMSPEERKIRKSECDKRYRENNKEKILEMKKRHYALKGNEQAKAWQKKMMNDIGFRIKKNLRGRIYVALKRGVKSESTVNLLGCSIEQFKKYFESLFTDGMSWDKYLEGGIHIDHRIPCKNFDLTKPEDQKRCFHYSNLQPLWELDNLRKGTSLNYKQKVA